MSRTDTPGDWRSQKATGGCILEVPSSRVVATGLVMPHSPRLYHQRLWVLNSGRGELARVDIKSGELESIVALPGYTR